MKKGNVFTVPFRRKREGKTYYKKRLKLLSANKYRLVIRRSSKNLQASIITYDPNGDKVIFTVTTNELNKYGWKGNNANLPSAYLVGILVGKKAIEKDIKEAILDLGFNKSIKGSRLYAALAGVIDAGLKIPFKPEVLPPKERITGEHIVNYAKLLKDDKAKYEKQFSNYCRIGLNPDDIVKHFNEVKGKING